MTEASLTQDVLRLLRTRAPGAVVLKHNDRVTSGIPDISITLGGHTVWWEVKHADPKVISKGIQELTMLRLAGAGRARYLIFEEKNEVRRTMVVHPRHFADLLPYAFCTGFNLKWACAEMLKVHEVLDRV